ncbi:MAG TPA: hypothetical protein ENK57_09220 [Polyangiaceae bacterium]|nr:hypothetical protein [Polyangiaceae bacterium]
MAKDPLSKLSPATHRVIAAALLHERAKGKPMTVARITRLCEDTGASLGACLASIHGLGRNLDTGKLVRLGSPEHKAINAPDDETMAALDWLEKLGDPGPR